MNGPQMQSIALDLIDDPQTELRYQHDPVALHELAQDIATKGLLQPIGVKAIANSTRFRRLWGGRRLAAHRLLGKSHITAIVVESTAPELDASVSENLHRADLTPVEEALAIRAATDRGYSAEHISLRWHKSPRWVEDRLDILTWPEDVLDRLHAREISLGIAAYLARVDNPGYRAHLTDSAISGGASTAVVRAWVAEYEAQRPRIIANQTTIEELKARPRNFTIRLDCDSCSEPVPIQDLTTYRICPRCDSAVRAQTRTP